MRCLFVFRDASGWLPTAQDLRQCGFQVSEAALPPARYSAQPTRQDPGARGGLVLAAEPHCKYGAEPQSLDQADPPPRCNAEPQGPQDPQQPPHGPGQPEPLPDAEPRPASPAAAADREDSA